MKYLKSGKIAITLLSVKITQTLPHQKQHKILSS